LTFSLRLTIQASRQPRGVAPFRGVGAFSSFSPLGRRGGNGSRGSGGSGGGGGGGGGGGDGGDGGGGGNGNAGGGGDGSGGSGGGGGGGGALFSPLKGRRLLGPSSRGRHADKHAERYAAAADGTTSSKQPPNHPKQPPTPELTVSQELSSSALPSTEASPLPSEGSSLPGSSVRAASVKVAVVAVPDLDRAGS